MYIDKGVIIFDSLRNTPYFIKLKRDPSRYKKDPRTYPYIKLLFVKLIKIAIIIRIYRDIPQGKLVV